MAGIGYRGNRIKADSLLEVIIAAILVVLIFGVAMMVVSNVTRTSRPVKKVKAEAILRSVAEALREHPCVNMEDTAVDDFRIIRTQYAIDNTDACHLHLAALDGRSDTVAVWDQILIKHEN
ncbi:hypothetical protein CKK33_14590 [Mucilaginibacter sp. MD40]|uniref:type IV pilus modification PilV family protein n=1 Tax=Mucilaginibacter sp. MD40 TaxID=2029590 RepID=UPI000BAC6D47|nr:hypothetical protein [Mucilaginibacter sp. MD40]PAW94654.1 hypothetical protein CKK33_14590 [Mucilaginibacter sp. MD40]